MLLNRTLKMVIKGFQFKYMASNKFGLADALRRDFPYASFDHLLRYLMCRLHIHSPYPSYVYPGCWVCSQGPFQKEHEKFLAKFKIKK